METVNIKLDYLFEVFFTKLVKHSVEEEEAKLIASVFTENASYGILTHSVYRFERLITQIDKKIALPSVKPKLCSGFCAIERYDGQMAIGVSNAVFAMNRAMELSKTYGLGCVGIKNTNHWMRAGYYARLASKNGNIGICWTNTMPNMCAWKSEKPVIGNNPIAIGIGESMLIDCSMSQFSVGKTQEYALQNKELPFPGGWDKDKNLTTDASLILQTRAFLPSGYWKGSGFSIILDTLASLISGGTSTSQMSKADPMYEAGLSQVFISIDANKLGQADTQSLINGISQSLGPGCRYPGAKLEEKRNEALKNGIDCSSQIWSKILEL